MQNEFKSLPIVFKRYDKQKFENNLKIKIFKQNGTK